MAFLGTTFDATTVAPGGSTEVIPAGDYRAMIIDSAMEPTKNGSGQFLKLTISVLDGPKKGAVIFDRLNLVNNNQTAVDIAQRTLSAICHAISVMQVQDSDQLHNRPLMMRVAVKEDAQYGQSNEIKRYLAVSAGAAPATAASYTPPAAAPAPSFAPNPAPSFAPNPPVAAAPAPTASPIPVANDETPPWLAAAQG